MLPEVLAAIPSLKLRDWIFALEQFFNTGGWVLYLILAVAVLMSALIIERIGFRLLAYPRMKRQLLAALAQHPGAWQRRSLVCDLDMALSGLLPMIKNLITLCPLIGLLGTVTGMIMVFDSLAHYGTGNPRVMAAGVASATFPTMTGMAVAVVGLLFYNRLHSWSQSERHNLQLKAAQHEEMMGWQGSSPQQKTEVNDTARPSSPEQAARQRLSQHSGSRNPKDQDHQDGDHKGEPS